MSDMNKEISKRIADKIVKLRKENNLSQTAMARQAGITPGAYSMKETGKREFKLNEVTRLADFFHLTLEELINDRHIEQLTCRDLGLIEETADALERFCRTHGPEAAEAISKALSSVEVLELLSMYWDLAEYDGEYEPPKSIIFKDISYEVQMTKASLRKVVGTALIRALRKCREKQQTQ